MQVHSCLNLNQRLQDALKLAISSALIAFLAYSDSSIASSKPELRRDKSPSVFEKTRALTREDIGQLLREFQLNGVSLFSYSSQIEASTFGTSRVIKIKKQFCDSTSTLAPKKWTDSQANDCLDFLELLAKTQRRGEEYPSQYPVEMFGPKNEVLAILSWVYGLEIKPLRKDPGLDRISLEIERHLADTIFFKGPMRAFDAVDNEQGYFILPRLSSESQVPAAIRIPRVAIGNPKREAASADTKPELLIRKTLGKGKYSWQNPESSSAEAISLGHRAFLALETAITRRLR